MRQYLLYLYAESPVHAGAADSIDVLDLPIQREAATEYPVIWGQSLKGALREAARGQWDDALVKQIFGRDVDSAEDERGGAGQLAVGDAQLVAMPVPTLQRTFAWVTSDIALARLRRKYSQIGRDTPSVPQLSPERAVSADEAWIDKTGTVLGPLAVQVSRNSLVSDWADRIAIDVFGEHDTIFPAKLRTDLLVVGSTVAKTLFRECTEQTVRVQLDSDKQVENGPFYSEYLPSETVLAASLVLRDRSGNEDGVHARLHKLLNETVLQIGGDESIGKGLVWARLIGSVR